MTTSAVTSASAWAQSSADSRNAVRCFTTFVLMTAITNVDSVPCEDFLDPSRIRSPSLCKAPRQRSVRPYPVLYPVETGFGQTERRGELSCRVVFVRCEPRWRGGRCKSCFGQHSRTSVQPVRRTLQFVAGRVCGAGRGPRLRVL